jgi:predicted transcriptional regulator
VAFPIVKHGTPIEEVLIIYKENEAVLVELENGNPP